MPLAPRDAALLAWLALEGPTPRTRLAALLWPQSTPESAGNALRQRLFQLRRQLGVELVSGNATLALAAGVEHDLVDSRHVLGDAGDELGPELAAWLGQQRERRALRHRAELEGRADAAEQARDYDDALAHARELLALEPLSEARAPPHDPRALPAGRPGRGAARVRPLRADAEGRGRRGAVGGNAGAAGDDQRRRRPRVAGAGPGPAGERAAAAAADRPRDGVARAARGLGRRPQRRRQRRGRHGQEPAGRRLRAGARPHPRRRRAAGRQPGRLRLRGAAAARPARRLPARPRACRCGAPSPGCCPSSASRRRCPAAKARRASSTPSARRSRTRRWRWRESSSTTCTSPTPPASSCCSTRSAHRRRRWIVTARAGEVSIPGRALLDEVLAPGSAERVALAPLTLGDIAEIVDSLGIEALQGHAIAATLLRHCGGNPLYLLETLKAWIGGRGRGGDGALPARLPLAGTLHAVIERRIAHLSADAVRLARCAAIAAPDFSIELASHVLGLRTLDLADPCAELEQAQVLRDGAFVHDLIYESALASVPAPVARQLHAEVAAFLQQRQGEPARLAQHWVQAGEWAPAGAAFLAAAERSRQTASLAEQSEPARRGGALLRARRPSGPALRGAAAPGPRARGQRPRPGGQRGGRGGRAGGEQRRAAPARARRPARADDDALRAARVAAPRRAGDRGGAQARPQRPRAALRDHLLGRALRCASRRRGRGPARAACAVGARARRRRAAMGVLGGDRAGARLRRPARRRDARLGGGARRRAAGRAARHGVEDDVEHRVDAGQDGPGRAGRAGRPSRRTGWPAPRTRR